MKKIMKKSSWLTLLLGMFLFAGCGGTTPQPPQPKSDCVTLCESKIKTLCKGKKYDKNTCIKRCAGWSDETIKCIGTAVSCGEVDPKRGFCIKEHTPSDSADTETEFIDPSCHKACTNYKKCAMYGDDVTAQNGLEAYNTCMSECAHWKPQTVKCMSQVKVTAPAHCAKVSSCGLKEYTGKGLPGY